MGGVVTGTNTSYSMEDVYIDAISQFLKGDTWRTKVLSYVDTHCERFSTACGEDSDFSHEQYDIWHRFKELVDTCVATVLRDLGGDDETFARACEERLKERDRGPRDAAVKDVLRKLLTFDSFEEFAGMMNRRWDEVKHDKLSASDYLRDTPGAEETKSGKGEGAQWACAKCTFLNPGNVRKCDMCGEAKRTRIPRPQMTGSVKERTVDEISDDLTKQKAKCRRSQFRMPGTLLNRMYDLVKETGGEPSSKQIVECFENSPDSSSSMNALLTNPTQVTELIADLKRLQEYESELSEAYNKEHVGQEKGGGKIPKPRLSANARGTPSDPDGIDPSILAESQTIYKVSQEEQQRQRQREESDLERALQLSLLEAERMKTRMLNDGLWEMTGEWSGKASPKGGTKSLSPKQSPTHRNELLSTLKGEQNAFKEHAQQAKDAIAEAELKEAQLQLEKAELEEKLIAEKLAKEHGERAYREDMEKIARDLEVEEQKRKELEHALASAEHAAESKVSETSQHAKVEQERLQKALEESNLRAHEMANEMKQKIEAERRVLAEARAEAVEKDSEARLHEQKSNKLSAELEEERSRRAELERAMRDLQKDLESKVSDTSDRARGEKERLQAELDTSNRREKEVAEEMRKRVSEERAAAILAQAEAHEKAKAMELHAERSSKLQAQLETESRKRQELEKALREVHAQAESKVSETSTRAKAKERELEAQLEELNMKRKAMEAEMEKRIADERAALEKVRLEAQVKSRVIEGHQERSSILKSQLEKEEERRTRLETALLEVQREVADKLSESNEKAREKESRLLRQLEETNNRAGEMASEMERQLDVERRGAEEARAKAIETGKKAAEHEERSMVLQQQLEEENDRRAELEHALEEMKQRAESKVSETSEKAKAEQAKLQGELDKLKKRASKRNKRMHMLLEALHKEEQRVKDVESHLSQLRVNYESKASSAEESSKELAKKETKFILEMQEARKKTDAIRKEMGQQLASQRKSAMDAMDKARSRLEEREAKLEEEKRKRAELEKVLYEEQLKAKTTVSEAERLKAELARKDAALKAEAAKREALLQRLTQFEKGQSMLAQKHAMLAQRHAATMGMKQPQKTTSAYQQVLTIRDQHEKEVEGLTATLQRNQAWHREKIKARLENKRRGLNSREGGRRGMGELKAPIMVQGARVVDFTSDDEDF